MVNKARDVQLKTIAKKIATRFKPEKIILFGSYAWGKPTKDSDVDLFIIKKSKNTREIARAIDSAIFPRPFPVDIVVYAPEQVRQREKKGDFFIRDILQNGRVLYGKKS